MYILIWLFAIAAFLVLEAVTYQLVSVWFAAGCIGGLIAASLDAGLYAQLAVFAVVSAAALLLLRPLTVKLIKPKGLRTNADGLIGKEVLITKDVSNIGETGEGRVSGMTWTVRSENGENIPKGTVAQVVRIEGVKLIVKTGV